MENIVENNKLEKRNLIINQIKLQNKIQSLGINLVNCGNCGSIFFHECDDNDTVKCPFCYTKMAKSDCPDYFYEGLELSGEFDFNNQIETITENPAFLSKFGEGFTCTDADNFQFGKELSENRFRFVEINRSTLTGSFYPRSLEDVNHFELIQNTDWYDEVIDLEDYTELDIDRIISGYYDSVEVMKEIYGEPNYKFIIAECIFEQETQY